MEDAPRKFFRLAPGREVRLRYACLITCTEVIKDSGTGEIRELRCTWDPESRGGNAPDGRKVRGTIHWVSVKHACPIQVRLYDRIFTVENPQGEKDDDFLERLNPDSLRVVTGFGEPSLAKVDLGTRMQFERVGYFCVDTEDSESGALIFNRTVSLKDSFAKRP